MIKIPTVFQPWKVNIWTWRLSSGFEIIGLENQSEKFRRNKQKVFKKSKYAWLEAKSIVTTISRPASWQVVSVFVSFESLCPFQWQRTWDRHLDKMGGKG